MSVLRGIGGEASVVVSCWLTAASKVFFQLSTCSVDISVGKAHRICCLGCRIRMLWFSEVLGHGLKRMGYGLGGTRFGDLSISSPDSLAIISIANRQQLLYFEAMHNFWPYTTIN